MGLPIQSGGCATASFRLVQRSGLSCAAWPSPLAVATTSPQALGVKRTFRQLGAVRPVRVKLPSTPTMRYERMAIAFVAGVLAGAVGCAFLAQAVGAVATVRWADLLAMSPGAIQAVTLLLLAFCALAVASALLLLAAIKTTAFQRGTHKSASAYFFLRRLAIQLLQAAAGLASAFIVFQAAAILSP